jgi:epsilon-lactone hydrolase
VSANHKEDDHEQESDQLTNLYRSWVDAFGKSPNMAVDERRNMLEHWGDVTVEPGGVDYAETDAGGVPAMWAVPKGSAQDRVILCMHGGGFVTGSMYSHRKVFAHLAKAVGARALILNFRRTPEHAHPAQVEDTVTAYRWLLEQGIEPNHIAFARDSAGGGLAVSALILARDRGLPLPAASMPLSPWVDMELSGETMVSNVGKDALFSGRESIEVLVTMLLGQGGNRRDPLASPLYGDLRRLPPLYIQVGGDELLVDDSRRLAERAQQAGLEVRLDIVPGQQHCFLFSAGRTPEADQGIRRWADWVRPKLGLTT